MSRIRLMSVWAHELGLRGIGELPLVGLRSMVLPFLTVSPGRGSKKRCKVFERSDARYRVDQGVCCESANEWTGGALSTLLQARLSY